MKKILILGGGFAGIYTAKNLQKQNLEDYEIELISDNNYFILSDNAGSGKLGTDNGGAYTLKNPSNIVAGQSGSIFVVQPSAGGKQLGYEGQWHFAGGTAPDLGP